MIIIIILYVAPGTNYTIQVITIIISQGKVYISTEKVHTIEY